MLRRMRSVRLGKVAVVVGFLMSAGAAAYAEMREFTDRQERKVRAELVGVVAESVELRLESGEVLTIPLSVLSEADQNFVNGAPDPGVSTAASPEAPVPSGRTSRWADAVDAAGPWDYSGRVTGLSNVDFRIWVPSVSVPPRGMLVLVPGANGDGRGQATDSGWQDLARELGFGIVACFFRDATPGGAGYCYAQNGSGAALLEAIDAAAKEFDLPDLKKSPLLLWGHSAGGQFNYNFACWKPQRTLGFIVNKGGFYYDTQASPATRSTPAILFVGEKDTNERNTNITNLFESNRSRGALWGLCVEPNTGHGEGRSREVAREFFRSIVAVRMPGESATVQRIEPTSGWLGDLGTGEVFATRDFKGNVRRAAWFPDEATARAWASAVSR